MRVSELSYHYHYYIIEFQKIHIKMSSFIPKGENASYQALPAITTYTRKTLWDLKFKPIIQPVILNFYKKKYRLNKFKTGYQMRVEFY